jgi:hypothetical protein
MGTHLTQTASEQANRRDRSQLARSDAQAPRHGSRRVEGESRGHHRRTPARDALHRRRRESLLGQATADVRRRRHVRRPCRRFIRHLGCRWRRAPDHDRHGKAGSRFMRTVSGPTFGNRELSGRGGGVPETFLRPPAGRRGAPSVSPAHGPHIPAIVEAAFALGPENVGRESCQSIAAQKPAEDRQMVKRGPSARLSVAPGRRHSC